MSRKIATSYVVTLGLMLFAMYFGAGNLIFPALLGQQAGTNLLPAIAGFILTGIGLPLLTFLVLVASGKNNVQGLASRVNPVFGVIFSVVMYLSIGPLFAMPRTGTVSFEIGIKPFVSGMNENMILCLFTLIFFSIACVLALSPGKVVDIVGKYLTPIMVSLIAILIITAVIFPRGNIYEPQEDYQVSALITGFKEGYLTLDAIASFVFGIIIINAIQSQGITEKKAVFHACLKAVSLAGVLLAMVYGGLSYMSATSVDGVGYLTNGGEVLAASSNYYFSIYGSLILGGITILACLTTSIGLLTACSQYFNQLYSKVSYKQYVILLAIFSFSVSNLGLTNLIKFSVPLLNMIYPLVIALVFLVLLNKCFRGNQRVYQMVMLFTFIFSVLDGLKSVPGISKSLEGMVSFFDAYMPMYSLGLGWLVPALIGYAVGSVWASYERKENPEKVIEY